MGDDLLFISRFRNAKNRCELKLLVFNLKLKIQNSELLTQNSKLKTLNLIAFATPAEWRRLVLGQLHQLHQSESAEQSALVLP